jgi:hypothetical protein
MNVLMNAPVDPLSIQRHVGLSDTIQSNGHKLLPIILRVSQQDLQI